MTRERISGEENQLFVQISCCNSRSRKRKSIIAPFYKDKEVLLRWFNIFLLLFFFSQSIVGFNNGEIMDMAERGDHLLLKILEAQICAKWGKEKKTTPWPLPPITAYRHRIFTQNAAHHNIRGTKNTFFLITNQTKTTFEHSKIFLLICCNMNKFLGVSLFI